MTWYTHIILCTDQFSPPNDVNTVSLERVSPKFIYLHPPKKLVIEIKATGRYSHILWQKNGALLTQKFPNFNEILIYEIKTSHDLGLYEVNLQPMNILQRVQPGDLDFLVFLPGKLVHDSES